MTKNEFEKYTGNLRIKSINFDILSQMWENAINEYDPKTEVPIAKFYIGKIGKYQKYSYNTNSYLRCSSIYVTFANGYDVMVTPDDVEPTDEEQTLLEFLPEIEKEKNDNYVEITTDQKEFADKVFLQLIAGHQDLSTESMTVLFDQAVSLALYRSEMLSITWDTSWISKLNE